MYGIKRPTEDGSTCPRVGSPRLTPDRPGLTNSSAPKSRKVGQKLELTLKELSAIECLFFFFSLGFVGRFLSHSWFPLGVAQTLPNIERL